MGRHSTAGTAPILSCPQAGSKDKKERGGACSRGESGEKKKGREIGLEELSVDSKGMEGFSTPNSQRLSMHS
jgi:hypothetical protein